MANFTVNAFQDQIKQLQQDGYCCIPNAIPSDLLIRLQDLFDSLMEDEKFTNKATNTINGITYTSNLDKLIDKGNLSCLELLGMPLLLELAAAICGPDFFMIQEFGVIKMLGDNVKVLWHQDMLHARTGTCITVGVYLDDAKMEDGALQVVPESHLSEENICALQKQPFVQVPMKAGDLLIHDMMLAHASQPLQKNKIRRVLYFEFLSATQAINEAIYTSEVIQNRMQLLQVAIAYYQENNPNQKVFNWQNPLANRKVSNYKLTLESINKLFFSPKTSAYCLEH